ncbi:MAG: amidohydrolase [Kangiellaceae bacterium]
MRKLKLVFLLVIFFQPLKSLHAKNYAADLVIVDAYIYTANERQPRASALAIKDNRIVYVGDQKGTDNYIDDETDIIELAGKMLLPGFVDTHNHIFEGASQIGGNCQLDKHLALQKQTSNLKVCQSQVVTKDTWVIGYGHQLDVLMSEVIEDTPREFLDHFFPNNPVIIMEESSHSMLVNSNALRLAGINSESDHPQGGRIMFDEKGEPNGILFDNAGDSVMELAWNAQSDVFQQSYDGLLDGISEVSANGITSVGDGRLYWRRGWYEVWEKARTEGELTLRVSLRPWVYPEIPLDSQLKILKEMYDPNINSLLIVDQVKMYSDGVLHFGTAKMLRPYNESMQVNDPKGLNYIPPRRLNKWISELRNLGYGAHIHAVGDAGIRQSVDAIQKERIKGSQLRYGLTHLELIDPIDIKRFSKLNIDADFQAGADSFADHSWAEYLVGKKRAKQMFLMRDLFDTGVNITFSSDWTVNPLNPLVAIANSVRWSHKQGLPNIDEAIYAATLNGAKALGLASITGSIEVGKSADLVVLGRDITRLNPDQIEQTKILMTIFRGEVVYGRDYHIDEK